MLYNPLSLCNSIPFYDITFKKRFRRRRDGAQHDPLRPLAFLPSSPRMRLRWVIFCLFIRYPPKIVAKLFNFVFYSLWELLNMCRSLSRAREERTGPHRGTIHIRLEKQQRDLKALRQCLNNSVTFVDVATCIPRV